MMRIPWFADDVVGTLESEVACQGYVKLHFMYLDQSSLYGLSSVIFQL